MYHVHLSNPFECFYMSTTCGGKKILLFHGISKICYCMICPPWKLLTELYTICKKKFNISLYELRGKPQPQLQKQPGLTKNTLLTSSW